MNTDPSDSDDPPVPQVHRSPRVAAMISMCIAMVWSGLAWHSPTTTYHLAPILVAASLPIASRLRAPGPLARRTAWRNASGGAAIGIVAAVGLDAIDWLRGPTVIDHGSALAESALAAIVGALWAARTAQRKSLPWWMRTVAGVD